MLWAMRFAATQRCGTAVFFPPNVSRISVAPLFWSPIYRTLSPKKIIYGLCTMYSLVWLNTSTSLAIVGRSKTSFKSDGDKVVFFRSDVGGEYIDTDVQV